MARPDGIMTPEEIEVALVKLAPDAIGLLEGVLRGTKRPNKAGRPGGRRPTRAAQRATAGGRYLTTEGKPC